MSSNNMAFASHLFIIPLFSAWKCACISDVPITLSSWPSHLHLWCMQWILPLYLTSPRSFMLRLCSDPYTGCQKLLEKPNGIVWTITNFNLLFVHPIHYYQLLLLKCFWIFLHSYRVEWIFNCSKSGKKKAFPSDRVVFPTSTKLNNCTGAKGKDCGKNHNGFKPKIVPLRYCLCFHYLVNDTALFVFWYIILTFPCVFLCDIAVLREWWKTFWLISLLSQRCHSSSGLALTFQWDLSVLSATICPLSYLNVRLHESRGEKAPANTV